MNRSRYIYVSVIIMLIVLITALAFHTWNTPNLEQGLEDNSSLGYRVVVINGSSWHVNVNDSEYILYVASMDTVLKNISIAKIYNPILILLNDRRNSSIQTLINLLSSNTYRVYPNTDIDGVLYYNSSSRNIIVFIDRLTDSVYNGACALIHDLSRILFLHPERDIYGYYLCTDKGIIETYLLTETKILHIPSDYNVTRGKIRYNYTTTTYLEFIAPANIDKGIIEIYSENGFISTYDYTIDNRCMDTCIFETNLKPFRLIDYSDFSEELVKFMFNHESSSNRSYGCARLVIFHNENLTLQYSIHIGDEESSIRLTLSY